MALTLENITIQISILGPAFLAGLLVLCTHIPLGREVLKRGIIFLDLAIAQVAGLGLILASLIGIEADGEHGLSVLSQSIAVGSAMIGASVLYGFRHIAAHIQEALIGILFVLAATGGILLLSKDPHGGERLKEILVGQILWVEYGTLAVIAAVYAAILSIWHLCKQVTQRYLFYPLFAVTITLSTQLVGVYLVFASLIIPALATEQSNRPNPYAFLIGTLGYLSGLVVAALLDLPPGAMITWCLVATALLIRPFIRTNHAPEKCNHSDQNI